MELTNMLMKTKSIAFAETAPTANAIPAPSSIIPVICEDAQATSRGCRQIFPHGRACGSSSSMTQHNPSDLRTNETRCALFQGDAAHIPLNTWKL